MRRVFLVDDEALALRRLGRMLEATGRVEIVGQTTDPEAAVEAIRGAAELDLVFLDISMPGLDGFELSARLPPGLMVVFTTAHDEHALRAFQTNAIDYLLKPVRAEELARALDKLDRLRALPAEDARAQLAQTMAAILAARAPGRIASRLGDKIHLIDLDRITHFVAEDKLTYAVTAEHSGAEAGPLGSMTRGRSYVIDPSIAELEDRYATAGFFRIHRATLVRLSAIVELSSTPDGTRVRLADGKTELPVARERVRALKDKLGL
jgi:two-component system LytT family response regulator